MPVFLITKASLEQWQVVAMVKKMSKYMLIFIGMRY